MLEAVAEGFNASATLCAYFTGVIIPPILAIAFWIISAFLLKELNEWLLASRRKEIEQLIETGETK